MLFKDIIDFSLSMTYQGYFAILAFLTLIFAMIINPLLFKFWIIPKIENRYCTTFIFDEYTPIYYPFVKWLRPHGNVAIYIVLAYIGLHKLVNNSKSRLALKKINYDIYTASRSEIVMSFISIICLYGSIVCAAIAAS